MERARFATPYDWQQTSREHALYPTDNSRFQTTAPAPTQRSHTTYERFMNDQRRFKQRKVGSREFPAAVRNQIKERQGYKCAVLGEGGIPLEVHHIVPKSHGGQGTPDNGIAVSHEVHVFLDKMAQYRHVYYMEMGREYVIGYLNATPDVQNQVVHGRPHPSVRLAPSQSFADSDLAIAAGD